MPAKTKSQKHPVKTIKTQTRVLQRTEPEPAKAEEPKSDPSPVQPPVEAEGGQHVPGQVEVPPMTPERAAELRAERDEDAIPIEGNNIAIVRDRAFADTPPANNQAPVEKTFVPPRDAHTRHAPGS